MNKEIEKAITNLYEAINLGDIGITRRVRIILHAYACFAMLYRSQDYLDSFVDF